MVRFNKREWISLFPPFLSRFALTGRLHFKSIFIVISTELVIPSVHLSEKPLSRSFYILLPSYHAHTRDRGVTTLNLPLFNSVWVRFLSWNLHCVLNAFPYQLVCLNGSPSPLMCACDPNFDIARVNSDLEYCFSLFRTH